MECESDEPNRGGRPAFEVTDDMREQVKQAVSFGMPLREVASYIGCDEKTLRKHFDEEICSGRAHKRMEVINLLFKSAREGNVSAQKHLDQQIALAGDFGIPSQSSSTQSRPYVPKEEKPGKKEQLQALANEAPPEGSKWSGLIN